MVIRKADREDSSILDNMLTELIKDEMKYNNNINPDFVVNNFYENYIDDDNRSIYVALEDDIIVGYIYGYIIDTDNSDKYKTSKLDALYVLKEYRNRMIASSLIHAFKNWCTTKEIKEIQVNVLTDNIIAKNLYKKHSFKTKSETMVLNID